MNESWSDPAHVLGVVERVLAASRPQIVRRFSLEVAPLVPHRAAAMQTGDCARVPVKVTGDEAITELVTSAELAHLASLAEAGGGVFVRDVLGGETRPLLLLASDPPIGKGALLAMVLTEDAPPPSAELDLVVRLWNVLGIEAGQRATEPEPELLDGSLAAASARAKAITDLSQTHATTLSALLSVLRSAKLPDASARRTATDLAAEALLDLRAVAERDQELSAESAADAFSALEDQLAPLTRHSEVAVELVGPGDGPTLAQDIAHTARTVTRGLVLAAADDSGTTRVRASWRFDGPTLLVTVRDDRPDADASVTAPGLAERIAPLGGRFEVDAVPGWGTTVTAVLPLAVAEPPEARPLDRLHAREIEVLSGISRGLRNRQIAEELRLSEHTVKFHVRNILDKLDVSSRGEAAALARELRLDPARPRPA